jgi:hypothetical protein
MNMLDNNTPVSELISGDVSVSRLLIHQIGKDLTVIKAAEAPKVFQLKKAIGEENLMKLVCMIVKSFCVSLKLPKEKNMDTVDIIECAEDYISTYTHDSVKDLVMALKMAKKRGLKVYHGMDGSTIMGIVSEYMEQKASAIESEHQDRISRNDGETRSEAYTLSVSQEKSYERQKDMYEQKELNLIKSEVKKLEDLNKIITKSIDIKID